MNKGKALYQVLGINMNHKCKGSELFNAVELMLGCKRSNFNATKLIPISKKALMVQIKKVQGVYDYSINGKKYEVKGVGLDSTQGDDYASLKKAGANTFRTWRADNAAAELQAANEHGLMVALGIELGQELHGFDYADKTAVKVQFEKVKEIVHSYKDQPNLLCWVVGNELNLLLDEHEKMLDIDTKAWEAVADIVDFIHEVDPFHPVTTTLAGYEKSHIQTLLKFVPDLDFLSLQVYGELEKVHKRMHDLNIDKPFMLTEYGPTGHWEVPRTSWDREIEEASAPKARAMMKRIHTFFDQEKSNLLLGGFLFFWGQKQERTPTWYGVFNKTGDSDARLDELTNYWTGSYPENRAPLVESITINDELAAESIMLEPSSKNMAQVDYMEPDGDDVTIEWKMLEEVKVKSHGGAFEKEPDEVSFTTLDQKDNTISFLAPEQSGEYRLFAYVYDGKGKVGNANFPFLVN